MSDAHARKVTARSRWPARAAVRRERRHARRHIRRAGDSSHIAISVTENGFEPATIAVKKGAATALVFTRKTQVRE